MDMRTMTKLLRSETSTEVCVRETSNQPSHSHLDPESVPGSVIYNQKQLLTEEPSHRLLLALALPILLKLRKSNMEDPSTVETIGRNICLCRLQAADEDERSPTRTIFMQPEFATTRQFPLCLDNQRDDVSSSAATRTWYVVRRRRRQFRHGSPLARHRVATSPAHGRNCQGNVAPSEYVMAFLKNRTFYLYLPVYLS